jgi:NitT/TauT family transport system substrate-binding protein
MSWLKGLLLATTVLASSVSAAADKVKVGVGSFNLNNLPYYVALGLGNFEKEGLEISSENFATGGSSALQALLTGSINVAVGFYDHTIQVQSRGKDVVAFVLLARNSGLVMAVGNKWEGKIKDVPTLLANAKDLTFGVTAPGSSSDFFVRYLLDKNGINPKAAKVVAVGSGMAAMAALKQGQVDVLVNYDPAATMVKKNKAGTIIVDARTDQGARAIYGGIYPTSTLYASRDYLKANPAVAQKISNAMTKTLLWMQSHSAEEVASKIPRQYLSGGREFYVDALSGAKTLFSRNGSFEAKDLETPLKVLAAFNDDVANKPIDLKRTYTNEFVAKSLQHAK